jgi:hypothetical protein
MFTTLITHGWQQWRWPTFGVLLLFHGYFVPAVWAQTTTGAEAAAQATVGAPVITPMNWSAAALPPPSLQQQAIFENAVAHRRTPPVNVWPHSANVTGPFGLPETGFGNVSQGHQVEMQPTSEDANTQAFSPEPNAPVSILVSSALSPTTGKTPITEPAVAQSGRNVMMVGNWWAARSTNGGGTWSYINPYADMSDFCCDQDVIVDPARDMFMWYRQGLYSSAAGSSRFKLGVSTNGGSSFCTYDYRPNNLGLPTGLWWDYPALATSNNHLYIITNIYTAAGAFFRQVVLRWPLDSLRSCSGFSFNWLNGLTSGWATVAQGATTTMYIGDHRGLNNSFRVYRWHDNSTSTSWFDRTIPAYTFQSKNSACITPDGLNPCARGDSRLLAGWVRKGKYQTVGEVGFMWHAREGGGFPFPYVEAVSLREDTLAVSGRPLLWSSSGAWQYPYASPDRRGDLAVTASFMGGSWYTSTIFLISDDVIASGWDVFTLRVGNRGATAWGDYVRNRVFNPSGYGWVTAGHTQQGGSTGVNTEPRYYVIARPRDVPSVNRYRLTP